MNSNQLHDMLLGYPVTICTADQPKIQRGRFIISNTDTSQGPGEHCSPVENQNDLELDFKVFFFVDSCSPGIVFVESK